MSNRVIKDSIWSSKSLAKLPIYYQDQWPRWLLLADDWGCFNADPDVVKGAAYPKRRENIKAVLKIRQVFCDAGKLFIWTDDKERDWGFFVSWDGHQFCNASGVDNEGKYTKHRRKTPEPPEQQLRVYLKEHNPDYYFGDSPSGYLKFRDIIFEADNFTCQYCGKKKDLTIDHIQPIFKNGEVKNLNNLVTACKSCNSKKGGRTPEEAKMPLNLPTNRMELITHIMAKSYNNSDKFRQIPTPFNKVVKPNPNPIPNPKHKPISSQIEDLLLQFPSSIQTNIKVYIERVSNKNKTGVVTEGRKVTLLTELYNSWQRCQDDNLFGYALEQAINYDAPNIGYLNAIIKNKKTAKPK